ncbi:MAG: propanediol utilization protein, partial [Deltaproteobacteria bacterium]|nr:propanediol utilization protein [Deltaproteobacteria bacterium]
FFVETEEVALPLKQHAGAPSIPAVKEGSRVNKGDIVAKIPEGSIGANIHASIDGVVTHVDNKKIIIRR